MTRWLRYMSKKPEDEAQTEASVKETAQKVDWQTQKAEQARIRKIENALKKAEEKIAELEEKIASIDAECASGSGCELCKVRRTDETAEVSIRKN